MNINENIISVGLVLTFLIWEDYVPVVKVLIGVVTGVWLLYQLFRGIEKRGEEKQKRKEEIQKRKEEQEEHAIKMEKHHLELDYLKKRSNDSHKESEQ